MWKLNDDMELHLPNMLIWTIRSPSMEMVRYHLWYGNIWILHGAWLPICSVSLVVSLSFSTELQCIWPNSLCSPCSNVCGWCGSVSYQYHMIPYTWLLNCYVFGRTNYALKAALLTFTNFYQTALNQSQPLWAPCKWLLNRKFKQ